MFRKVCNIPYVQYVKSKIIVYSDSIVNYIGLCREFLLTSYLANMGGALEQMRSGNGGMGTHGIIIVLTISATDFIN